MGVKSTNKNDTYKWILTVIDSVVTFKHFIACRKLMRNHLKLYGDHDLYNLMDMHLDKEREQSVKNIGIYTWAENRPPKPKPEIECVCDYVRKHGGSGWCQKHHTDWV